MKPPPNLPGFLNNPSTSYSFTKWLRRFLAINYSQHAKRHQPGGHDPIPAGQRYYATPIAPASNPTDYLAAAKYNAAFQNSWANVALPDSSYSPLCWYFTPGGKKRIEGAIGGGAIGTVCVTLPRPFWPSSDTGPIPLLSTDGTTQLGVQISASTGQVTVTAPGTTALPVSGASPGTYGDATDVAQVTVDVTGRITKVASVAIQLAESAVTNLVTDLAGKLGLSVFTTKGDLAVATGSAAVSRLGVGSDTQVLTADSTQTTGVKWAPGSGAVSSVFGRTGAVVAGNADYLAVASGGLTGATAATRFAGGTASGHPASGTFAVGDFVIDQTGTVWVCTVAGTPGTWISPAAGTGLPSGGASGQFVGWLSSGTGQWLVPPGSEIGYDQITVGVNVTGTTQGAGTTIITCGAHTFDGAAVLLEFYSPQVALSTTTSAALGISLKESSSVITDLAFVRNGAAITNQPFMAIRSTFRFTPSAGSHSYLITAYSTSTTGTPSIGAGAGSSGANVPAFVRFVKV